MFVLQQQQILWESRIKMIGVIVSTFFFGGGVRAEGGKNLLTGTVKGAKT